MGEVRTTTSDTHRECPHVFTHLTLPKSNHVNTTIVKVHVLHNNVCKGSRASKKLPYRLCQHISLVLGIYINFVNGSIFIRAYVLTQFTSPIFPCQLYLV